MAANEKNSGGIVNWFDTRFPVTDLLERHLSKYPAPTNSYWFVVNDELYQYC
jgi:quinol-cytochrome oxidoreductase complex cytochrome b subunit